MRDELSAIQTGVGSSVPFLGCLTFGEVGAMGPGAPQYHNKTAVVLALPGQSVMGTTGKHAPVRSVGEARWTLGERRRTRCSASFWS